MQALDQISRAQKRSTDIDAHTRGRTMADRALLYPALLAI
jgi:hypothetical protein